MSLVSNAESVHFGTTFDIDKVLGTFSGTITSPAPTASPGSTWTPADIPTGIPETTLWHGIFSTDGGVTWNNFNSEINRGATTQTITCYGVSQAGNFKIIARNMYDYNIGAGYAYTVLYKIVLFAKSTQGSITPQPIGSDLYFDSRYNYHKIALDGTTSMVVAAYGGRTTVTIPHNLGRIPRVKLYYEFLTTSGAPYLGQPSQIIGIYDHGLIIGGDAYCSMDMDATNIYITKDNGSAEVMNILVHYRVYYDN